MKIKRLIAAAALACAGLMPAGATRPFVDAGPAARFVEVRAQGLLGGAGVSQNFKHCFAEIRECETSMGTSWGVGARADLAFRDFLALGVETNLLFNNWKANMALANDDASSMSNVLLNNRFTSLNFPVFVSARFNVGTRVRWVVDGGMYYAYGVWGRQRQSIYKASVNQAGQLVTDVISQKVPYYDSVETFIASSHHSDIGLHVATSMVFNRHFAVGVRVQVGFKNQAKTYDAVTVPSIHNFNVMGCVGYIF